MHHQPKTQNASPTNTVSNLPKEKVIIGYNRYFQNSFSDSPSPLRSIRQAVLEKYPHIEVQLNVLPDSTRGNRDALVVWMMAEDSHIDIFGIDSPWASEFGEAQWIEPLNDHLPTLQQDFSPNAFQAFTWNNEILGVPIWGSVGGLFLSHGYFSRSGI